MSNFSNNENFGNKKENTEIKFGQTNADNKDAFLAALQETQNVLNVLLQSILVMEDGLPADGVRQIGDKLEENADIRNASIGEKKTPNSKKLVNDKDSKFSSDNDKVEANSSSVVSPPIINNKDSLINQHDETKYPKFEKDIFSAVSCPVILSNRQYFRDEYDDTEKSKFDNSQNCLPESVSVREDVLPTNETQKIGADLGINSNKNHIIEERDFTNTKEIVEENDVFVVASPIIIENEESINNEYDENEDSKFESDVVQNRVEIHGINLLTVTLEKSNIKSAGQEVKESTPGNSNISSNQTPNEQHQNISNNISSESSSFTASPLEPTISTLEREILHRGDQFENKKATVLRLPPELTPFDTSCVGDDIAKSRAHILCECDLPSVAGGAVPVVTSFTTSQEDVPNDNLRGLSSVQNQSIHQPENTSYKPKPSLIPKLASAFKSTDRSSTQLSRTEKQRSLTPSSHHNKEEEERTTETVNQQEKLETTNSLNQQKTSITDQKLETENKVNQKEKHQLRFHDDYNEKQTQIRQLNDELSKKLSKLSKEAAKLSEADDISDQASTIDKIYKYVTEMKKYSNQINDIRSEKSGAFIPEKYNNNNNNNNSSSNESEFRTKSKDNKIYIKFLPTKSALKRKKNCNTEVQTEPTTKECLTCVTEPNSDTTRDDKKTNEKSGATDVDSMDGMFIPSWEEPPKMEEEEDDDGLDITITFPEFQQHILDQESSHLSVCFSDISAEALGRLKRCPKEFTLRMDFVQGKMFFKSGRSPANNFSIGPDLKIKECIIDNKMSDIISIKPSTECIYNSQIIPVEGANRKSSIKTLKSTDSELFNVVSLPKINRRTSGNTKSCITFKNERHTFTGCLLSDRRSYKSMPQIPSLSKIMEEPALECNNNSRTAMVYSDKKPKIRPLQRKRTNPSLSKMSEA